MCIIKKIKIEFELGKVVLYCLCLIKLAIQINKGKKVTHAQNIV